MTRCTVCGATSREGAKFCTSCGTRLADENDTTTTTAEPDTSTSTSSTTQASAPAIDPGASESSTPDAPAASTPDDDRYISSWPGGTEAAEPAPAEPDEATSARTSDDATAAPPPEAVETSWPSATPAPDHQAVDLNASAAPVSESDVSSNGNAPWPVESHAAGSTSEKTTSSESPADNNRPSGPSSRTSAATSEASTRKSSGTSSSDRFGRIHELIDEMQLRIERIQNPATLASRELDPDELADQLDRWARQVPNADELLGALREVRRSPKDIDALQQLSAHAADLELLVRHYQSITAKSDEWAAALRRLRDTSTES